MEYNNINSELNKSHDIIQDKDSYIDVLNIDIGKIIN